MMEKAKKIETLRRAFQDAPATTPTPESCPDAESIWDAAAGELSAKERRRVVSHLSTCPECAHAWRLAWAMQAEMREEAEDTGHTYTTVIGPWKRFAPQIAAAAMLILALGVGVVLTGPGPEPRAPVHRSAVVEHEIESLVPEDEALPREELVLRWTPAGEGAVYDVQVMTRELEPLAHAEDLEETTFEVSEEVLAQLPAEAEVLWRVEARLPDGTVQRSVQTFVTRIE